MINTSQLIKESMLAKNKISLAAYRSLKAKETVYLTAKRGNELNSEIQKGFIKREIKERKEAAEFLDKEFNLSVAAILESLLPKSLSEKEIKTEITIAIQKTQATSKADFGKVMKELKQNPKEIDMKIASNLLKLCLR